MTTAIILAGGLGTRLRSVVSDLPKPMAPILGRPFLEYLMDYWIKQGISRFIISVGYKSNVIIKHFGSSYQGANVEYSIENVPLGTGGAMLLASQGLSESFLVINGDTFIDIDLGKMLNFHGEVKSDWTMALIQSSNSVRYMGVDILDDGRVSSIKSNTNLANGGVYLIDPNAVERHKEAQNKKISLEDDLLPQLILNNGSLYGFESFGSFIDIGIPEDYERAVNILNSGI